MRLKLFAQYYQQNARFLDALETIHGKTHYFDGCKCLLRLELLRTVYPDTKIVHLIKNPNAYLHSVLQRKNKNYRKVVEDWIQYHSASLSLGNSLGPDRYLLLTFEELTSRPEAVITNLWRFMGVPKREIPISEWVDTSSIHVIGNRSKNEFRQVDQKVARWKSDLTKEQLDYVEKKVQGITWLQPLLGRLDWN